MRGPRRWALLALLGVVSLGCARSDTVSFPLAVEMTWMSEVPAPAGWHAYARTMGSGQSVRTLGDAQVVLAGEEDGGSVHASSAGVAWESPDLRSDTFDAACAAASTFVAAAGATAPWHPTDCVAALTDPGLQAEFVLSFWSEVAPSEPGSRSFGAGALRHTDGSLTLVVSLSATLGP